MSNECDSGTFNDSDFVIVRTMKKPRKIPRLRHKYNAQTTTKHGIRFASKKEANRYSDLLLAKQAGEVVMILRQVPFDLPGRTKYRADFLIFWKDGTVTVEDTKGYVTSEFRKVKKQVEGLYPVEIILT